MLINRLALNNIVVFYEYEAILQQLLHEFEKNLNKNIKLRFYSTVNYII